MTTQSNRQHPSCNLLNKTTVITNLLPCFRSLIQRAILSASMATLLLPFKAVADDPFKKIFEADTKLTQRATKKTSDNARKESEPTTDLAVRAGKADFRDESNTFVGSSGVLFSRAGVRGQAEKGSVQLKTQQAEFSKSVVITLPEASITSNKASFNFDTEKGVFSGATLSSEEDGYIVTAEEMLKVSELEYELDQAALTTCHCSDGSTPWKLSCSKAKLTEEGYAHTKNAVLDFHGVPLMFSPAFTFPIKTDRASGILVPTYGLSNKDGFELTIPVFAVIDDHSDLLFSPFVATSTRIGSQVEFRQKFSELSSLNLGLVYSNESARGKADLLKDPTIRTRLDPRGVRYEDIAEAQIDTNRFAIHSDGEWRTTRDAALPAQALIKGTYVSDNLILRELDIDSLYGDDSSRFTTTDAALRLFPSDTLSAEISGEYAQTLLGIQDQEFQRAPEFTANYRDSFRPFGYNALGARLIGSASIDRTTFLRDTGYDGSRTDITPELSVPFHLGRLAYASLTGGVKATSYDMDSLADPTTGNAQAGLSSSSSRTLPYIKAAIGTGLEKVYDPGLNGFFARSAQWSATDPTLKLQKLKSVIEPQVGFTFVPKTSQDDLPVFDSLDRINERQLVTYGFKTSILGKFGLDNPGSDAIRELTPNLEDLPRFSTGGQAARAGVRQNTVRELASLELKQGYDFSAEDFTTTDALTGLPVNNKVDKLTDLLVRAKFSPGARFSFGAETNLDTSESFTPSSWSLISGIRSTEGDRAEILYTFIDNAVSQFEGRGEVGLSSRFRFATALRYDEEKSSIISSRAGLRFSSSCDCWHIDFGYRHDNNPDRDVLLLNFTFEGLGTLAQQLSTTTFGAL